MLNMKRPLGVVVSIASVSDRSAVPRRFRSSALSMRCLRLRARRVTNARLDPNFLMAGVEIVASYDLYNINRTRLENLIHRIFGPTRLDIEIKDRFGQPVIPPEWFLVPLFVTNDTVERIKGWHDHRIYLRSENRRACSARERDDGGKGV
jgi:Meiotically up-regulated gene 113